MSVSTATQSRVRARRGAVRSRNALQQALEQTGYAALGAGDAAFELCVNVTRPYVEIPSQVVRAGRETSAWLRDGFVQLSDRGRTVALRIHRGPVPRRTSRGASNGSGTRRAGSARKTARKARAAGVRKTTRSSSTTRRKPLRRRAASGRSSARGGRR